MTRKQCLEREAKELREYREKVTGDIVDGREVKIQELHDVFDANRKTDHWKDPIKVTKSIFDTDLNVFLAAITFFQGCVPKVKALQGSFVVITSPGYVC